MTAGTAGRTLALALVAWACARAPDLAPVGAVVVQAGDLAGALAEAGLEPNGTAKAAAAGLAAAGFPVEPGARSQGYRATVEVVAVGVVPAGSGGARTPSAEVIVELSLDAPGGSGTPARESGRGLVPLAGRPGREAWRDALVAAVTEAARAQALGLRLARQTSEALVRRLDDADPVVRERVVRTLTARGARESARAIAARVHDPAPGVARAAVDALATFKDPATARALIDAAQSGDVAKTLRLLPILLDIGGPDVEGYLLTLESGHSDRAVRQAATQALAKLRRGATVSRGAKR